LFTFGHVVIVGGVSFSFGAKFRQNEKNNKNKWNIL
jgi:hypothetical protein